MLIGTVISPCFNVYNGISIASAPEFKETGACTSAERVATSGLWKVVL